MSGTTLAVRADAVYYRLVWWPCPSGGMWVLTELRLTRPSRRAGRLPLVRAQRAASRWR